MSEWIDTVLAAAAATVFVSLALTKAGDIGRFARAVAAYRLAPARLATPIARAVIGLELALGVSLPIPEWRPQTGALGIALLAAFMAAMLRVLRQGREVDCGCSFRPGHAPIGGASLARNAGLALWLLVMALLRPRDVALPWAATLNACVAGIAAALLYLALENLTALPILGRDRRAS